MSAHLGRLRFHHQKSPSMLRSRGPHVTSVTAMQPVRWVCSVASRDPSISSQPPLEPNDNFHRVKLAPAPYGPMQIYNHQQGSCFNGVLVFQQDSEDSPEDLQSILEVFVAGDVAFNTWMQLAPERQAARPMVHELLWAVLQQAQRCSSEPWALLHAAITEITDAVFVGRLYFGNPETGQVLWECDCRPSDGCYLSLQEALGDGSDGEASSNSKGRPHHHSSSPYLGASPRLSMQACVLIRPDDLEAVKLLKRALTLAVAEEDFEEAVRLRDHPWMQMSQDMARLRSMGRFTDARRVEVALRRQADAVDDAAAFDAILDPRYKMLDFQFSPAQFSQAEQALSRLVTVDGSQADQPVAMALEQVRRGWGAPPSELLSRTQLLPVHFAPHLTAHPLKWWAERGGFAPLLQAAAQRVLCIPATAAANERVFSSFKHIWSDKRSSLLLGRMWLLAFIYFNKRVLERRPKPQPEAEWQQFAQWMHHMPAEA
ncbi:hypothetical protein QJQ45_016016 [Haematococcus lacustris]|nr:hypothetical protein QJQ45_016016 [Haematococcus lacustris]